MPSLNLTAEDRFAIIDIATQDLAPDALTVGNLGYTAADLPGWDTIWDLRGTDGFLYNDIIDAFREAADYEYTKPTVLVSPHFAQDVAETLRRNLPERLRPALVVAGEKPLPKRSLDLTPFADDWDGNLLYGGQVLLENEESRREVGRELKKDAQTAVALGVVGSEREAFEYVDQLLAAQDDAEISQVIHEEIQAERGALLDTFLKDIASNSLLAQVALVHEADRISVIPIHGNSVHQVDCGEEALFVRPARKGSASQWGKFQVAVRELEELLNTTNVQEKEIENLLVRHPQFLRGLNYTQVYHQVILPMEEGRYLKPDIMAEPISQQWCDVIDVKLPQEPVFVGPADRPHLSYAVADAASQLRQYAKWFDDRKVAKRVEEKYGFKCHRPRQVVIIGRDPRSFTEAQRDAVRSSYPDLSIVTYDTLLATAKSRLLF